MEVREVIKTTTTTTETPNGKVKTTTHSSKSLKVSSFKYSQFEFTADNLMYFKEYGKKMRKRRRENRKKLEAQTVSSNVATGHDDDEEEEGEVKYSSLEMEQASFNLMPHESLSMEIPVKRTFLVRMLKAMFCCGCVGKDEVVDNRLKVVKAIDMDDVSGEESPMKHKGKGKPLSQGKDQHSIKEGEKEDTKEKTKGVLPATEPLGEKGKKETIKKQKVVQGNEEKVTVENTTSGSTRNNHTNAKVSIEEEPDRKVKVETIDL